MKDLSSLILRISISLVITLALGILFLSLEEPYTLELVEHRPWEPDKNTTYTDLNFDGKTERILLSNSAIGQIGLIVYTPDDKIINQYNITGKFVKRSGIFSGDYNRDGQSELFVFTYIGDSLFLNIVDVFNHPNTAIKRKYIAGCSSLHGEAQYIITGPVFEDFNDDGMLEFYFAISAGFTLQPRALYYYDIVNDSLKQSGLAGVAPRYTLDSYDLDGDGKLEIWGRSNAVGNYNRSMISYSDSSAWLMIYNHNLEYEFEPYEFSGFTSVLKTYVLNSQDEIKLLALRTLESFNDSVKSEIAIFSISGEPLIRKSLKEFGLNRDVLCYINKDDIYLVDFEGMLVILNQELNLQRSYQREALYGSKYGPLAFPDSDFEIFICQNPGGEITVYSSDLKKLASYPLDDNSTRNDIYPVYISRGKIENGFHLRTHKSDYAFSLERNKKRNYIYIYAITLFIAFYLIIYFIQLQQHRQDEKRRAIEARMRALQAQASKSQMSPHFIFNALNSISAMYIKGDTARADAFLTSFSKMIREVVDSSDRLVVTLREELEFVKNYLELEQIRHEGKLTYSINVPERCMAHDLPSMSIHTFVENSIKHGLRGKKKMELEVIASCDAGYLKISILDSGAGYENIASDDKREGRGLKIIEDIFNTYRDISGKLIEYSISDLGLDSGSKSGTKVEIKAKI